MAPRPLWHLPFVEQSVSWIFLYYHGWSLSDLRNLFMIVDAKKCDTKILMLFLYFPKSPQLLWCAHPPRTYSKGPRGHGEDVKKLKLISISSLNPVTHFRHPVSRLRNFVMYRVHNTCIPWTPILRVACSSSMPHINPRHLAYTFPAIRYQKSHWPRATDVPTWCIHQVGTGIRVLTLSDVR